MQLALTLSQHQESDRKGRSKVTFHLSYQLRVSVEERAIIDRYGLAHRYVVGDHTSPSDLAHTIERLLKGDSFSWSSTELVLQREQVVMKAAKNASALLSQVAAFNGRERIIDLDPGLDSESG